MWVVGQREIVTFGCREEGFRLGKESKAWLDRVVQCFQATKPRAVQRSAAQRSANRATANQGEWSGAEWSGGAGKGRAPSSRRVRKAVVALQIPKEAPERRVRLSECSDGRSSVEARAWRFCVFEAVKRAWGFLADFKHIINLRKTRRWSQHALPTCSSRLEPDEVQSDAKRT